MTIKITGTLLAEEITYSRGGNIFEFSDHTKLHPIDDDFGVTYYLRGPGVDKVVASLNDANPISLGRPKRLEGPHTLRVQLNDEYIQATWENPNRRK